MIKKAEILCREISNGETRVNEFCAKQVPAELFRYTLNQMRTIRAVQQLTQEYPAGVQLKMLAEKLNVTPAAASEMVDTLVRKGAILRQSDPADRRAVLLQVGDSLRERFDKCEKNLHLLVANFLETLDDSEVATVMAVAEKFSNYVADSQNLPEV
ncbi:MAG: MarR family transcriptional regulator [Lentisphaeria bacterium]|nr:MarR family transcriptional regulator [Lentisphaeria bacterium]